jgi:CubicO group peptidase (beta-lactamase class C family)
MVSMKVAGAPIVIGEAGSGLADAPLVPWWSFTKTVLAGAALVLVGRAQLDLDAPIEPLRFTLRHLLQHTSGLRDYGGVREYHEAVEAGSEPWSRVELLRRSRADDLLFAPGTSWAYSNIGYLFVREAIERAVDRDLNEALLALVFRPLGIGEVFVANYREEMRSTLWGHEDYHPGWVYHGLVVGPPSAAASVLHELLYRDVLSAALRAEMLTPLSLGGPFPGRPAVDPSYGLGVMLDPASALGRVVGHTGQGPGSTAAVYSFADLAAPRTLAAFTPDDRAATQGLLEGHLHTLAKAQQS